MSIDNRDGGVGNKKESIKLFLDTMLTDVNNFTILNAFICPYPCEIKEVISCPFGISGSPIAFMGIGRLTPNGPTYFPISSTFAVVDPFQAPLPLMANVPIFPNVVMKEQDVILLAKAMNPNTAIDKIYFNMVVEKIQDRVTYFGK